MPPAIMVRITAIIGVTTVVIRDGSGVFRNVSCVRPFLICGCTAHHQTNLIHFQSSGWNDLGQTALIDRAEPIAYFRSSKFD